MAGPAPRRPWGWRIHAALGAAVCTLLAVVCLTGTVATVSHELEWLAAERKRAGPLPHATSLGQRWDAARAALPGFTPTTVSRTGTASDREWYLATLVQGGAADGGQATVYVDPATARVLGVVHGVTFPSFMRGLHYYLFDVSPWTIGFYVLAGLGPVMLVMVVTGLRLERRWWSGLWRWPRRGQPARGWWGALHRLAALWSVPFILVIGTTVVWYLVEWDGWVDWNQWGPQITDARPLPLDRTVTGADIDRWVAIARERQPGLVVSGVALPWEPGGTVTVTGQRSALVVRERANAVHIDPVTDGIRAEQIAHAMPVHERWTHTADPLHFGDFAGLWSKLLWVGFGSLLVLVSVSGAVVCLRRVARRPEAP